MAILEFQTIINASPEKVFFYLSDLQKHVDSSGGEAIRKTSEGPIDVGATYETTEKEPLGLTLKEKANVTQYQPNERFGWRSYAPMGTWFDWSFELRPQHGGTLLIERLEPRGSLITDVLLKLFVEREMRKTMPEALTRIKEKIEGS